MGIISTLIKNKVKRTVERTAKVVTRQAVYQANERYEKGNPQKNNKFLSCVTDGHSRLIVGQKPYTFKESFEIYDEKKKVKYIVKGKLISATHDLTVYDRSGKNILGRVKEKLISLRSPLSFDKHPQDFVIEMEGKKLGKMKSRFAFGKRKFEFTFINWVLEGNIIGLKYKVLDGKDIIMEVGKTAWSAGDTYFLDVTNPENELLCILILLAIDSSHSSKARDNKRAARKKLLW